MHEELWFICYHQLQINARCRCSNHFFCCLCIVQLKVDPLSDVINLYQRLECWPIYWEILLEIIFCRIYTIQKLIWMNILSLLCSLLSLHLWILIEKRSRNSSHNYHKRAKFYISKNNRFIIMFTAPRKCNATECKAAMY